MGSYLNYDINPFLINKFYKIIFFLILILRSLITVSSYSWLIIWMGVEINIISIIPIILSKNNNYSRESSMKYFLIQRLASTLFIFSILIIEKMNLLYLKNWLLITLQISLIIKLGIAPIHFWLPEVIEGISWINCLIILTWQKIAPFIILIMTIKNSSLIIFSIIISSIIRGVLGINQLRLRKILAYSSINHIAWMIIRIIKFSWTWIIYFLVYRIRNLNLIIYFFWLKIQFINQLLLINKNKLFIIIIIINFLRLGGIPPLIGFLPKWLTIYQTIRTRNIIITIIIIITSLIHVFFYLRILIPSLIQKIKENKINKKNLKFNTLISINLIFLISIPLTNIIF